VRRGWYRLADRLGQPVEVVMRQTSYSQYLEWMEYLRVEVNDFHREDEYFNRILVALYQLLYKNTGKASPHKSSDFQLKFHYGEDTVESKQSQIDSKSVWMGMVGLSDSVGAGSSGNMAADRLLDSILG
jgi:hypothetical protein